MQYSQSPTSKNTKSAPYDNNVSSKYSPRTARFWFEPAASPAGLPHASVTTTTRRFNKFKLNKNNLGLKQQFFFFFT